MLAELFGKGGQLCQPAKEGRLYCPLMVRPSSEDVLTGNLFQCLGYLNPRWWVSDLLNHALGKGRFHRQFFRRFRIELWKNRPYYPRELLPWNEGGSQIDATILWENPPTTIFFEVKYGSALSPKTSGDDGQKGFPSNQLIRNARVGLLECGWFQADRLFQVAPRDFVLILLAPIRGHPLVQRYRDSKRLKAAIPHSERLPELPRLPFIGELGFSDIVQILQRQKRWFGRAERRVVEDICDYLAFKRSTTPRTTPNC